VAHIAARYRGRDEPTEDMQQVGTVGLMGALDRFAPPPDTTDLVGAFLAFAVPTVTGEIRKHFRDRTWSMRVPRRMKDLQARSANRWRCSPAISTARHAPLKSLPTSACPSRKWSKR
jgi:RNA polymerase sigma-B factor